MCRSEGVVESDVKVPNGLSVSGVHLEGIMSREDAVKIDVLVEEDVSPQGIRKGGAVCSNDESMFGSPNIDVVISSEGESARDVRINGGGYNGNVHPRVH